MRSALRSADRSTYTIRQAASILGVETATVSRAVRVGHLRAVLQRGRLVVPASSLTRLLGEPAENGGGR
ncbi:helix-turn-helix domain-containing protein [Saccharopolyspora sp. 6T]|uniref:helix-turn-helix domain-containing protein n=1 Tax=Saccharopolyspora sp. 6T TaxID=2877238 RepID=UPI001CD2CBA7|nr:helix-turn-helix domain-containing protein [Saccharopolyspora sp. 6T]MCA1187586.1 helix-turn-helix domain-containing protein [Saccharopolyspora sp. 6T]